MATNLNKLVLATLVVAALLRGSWAQTTHVVGDSLGWTIPPGGAVAYSSWASQNNFTVDDILVFNFSNGSHDVAEVTKAAFEACNATSPISISNSGPTNITLSTAGEHHYICTFTGHCTAGQKLAINVTATTTAPSPPPPTATAPTPSSTATPPPPPSPTGTATPSSPPPSETTTSPPPPNSATSLAGAALPVALLSIAVALLH
ncbi:Stellacyanin like [Actinidia chinensis var. chinensis]|uniref:Stellacyanin like n=1 Tax=Actinidia chinensis var. chinensis TaxID=1590841 RepID=A0A2R6QS02_ACTCC|nr:Stellacyanin like [Actinidia chinensis var. chinensis]